MMLSLTYPCGQGASFPISAVRDQRSPCRGPVIFEGRVQAIARVIRQSAPSAFSAPAAGIDEQ